MFLLIYFLLTKISFYQMMHIDSEIKNGLNSDE